MLKKLKEREFACNVKTICGNLINKFKWLNYNLKRSLCIITNDIEEIKLAENEAIKTIDEINRYIELIPTMYKIVCDLTKEGEINYGINNEKNIREI